MKCSIGDTFHKNFKFVFETHVIQLYFWSMRGSIVQMFVHTSYDKPSTVEAKISEVPPASISPSIPIVPFGSARPKLGPFSRGGIGDEPGKVARQISILSPVCRQPLYWPTTCPDLTVARSICYLPRSTSKIVKTESSRDSFSVLSDDMFES